MATLVDNYEQQYAVLTADITAKISRIAPANGGKLIHFINVVITDIVNSIFTISRQFFFNA